MLEPLSFELWRAATFLGDWRCIVPVALGVMAYLYWRGEKREALLFGVFLLLAELLTFLIKLFVSRPRPLDGLVVNDDPYSFPSGHATMATFFYGMLALTFIREYALRGGDRLKVVFALLALLGLVGASRVYLGVHYATDVLAGYVFGSVFLVVYIVFRRRVLRKA